MIADHLRIQPDQQALTPEQEAKARRFAEERIAAQLSTEPVDESEAEQLLQHAYAVAELPPPQQIHWVDGPLQLVAALAPHHVEASGEEHACKRVEDWGGPGWETAHGPAWETA